MGNGNKPIQLDCAKTVQYRECNSLQTRFRSRCNQDIRVTRQNALEEQEYICSGRENKEGKVQQHILILQTAVN
jgi:hypothetical protein